jgi:molybdenum cofactor cytidylyltransferase
MKMEYPVDGLFALVLAAGRADRFGSPKQLALFEGEPLARRALRVAESICGHRSILVVGSEWQRVHEACAPLAGFLVRNDCFEDGMASSIVAAIRALPDSARAALVMLADQPLVDADDLRRLVERWLDAPDRIVCSRAGDYAGPPVIFPRRFFNELVALRGDRGAKAVIRKHGDTVRMVDCDDVAIDVDTPADLARLNAGP